MCDIERSTIGLFAEDFTEWHLSVPPEWKVKNLMICQSHLGMTDAEKTLAIRRRGQYVLQKRLKSYPMEKGVIILDRARIISRKQLRLCGALTEAIPRSGEAERP